MEGGHGCVFKCSQSVGTKNECKHRSRRTNWEHTHHRYQPHDCSRKYVHLENLSAVIMYIHLCPIFSPDKGVRMNQIYDNSDDAYDNFAKLLRPRTFALHLHNSISRGISRYRIRPKQPIFKMFQKVCPNTFAHVVENQIGDIWTSY